MLKAETRKGRVIPMLSDGVVKDDRLFPFIVVCQLANQHFGEGELSPRTKTNSGPAFWIEASISGCLSKEQPCPPWTADAEVKTELLMHLESSLCGSCVGTISYFGENLKSTTSGVCCEASWVRQEDNRGRFLSPLSFHKGSPLC